MPTVHLIIKGRVQGVFYRASAREIAESLGLTGWVKNTEAGGVEIMVSGSTDRLEEFMGWCRKGPANAKVSGVEMNPVEETAFETFKILR